MRRRGFTLPELLVAMTLLMVLIIAIFKVLDMGVEGFNIANLRQSLQSEARRVSSMMLEDIKQTHFQSVSVYAPTSSTTPRMSDNNNYRRMALCLAGLDNWQNADNFDPVTGRPKWNRYICYYATTSEPVGNLIREEINPSSSTTDFPPVTFAGLSLTNHLNSDPSRNDLGPEGSFRLLAQQVEVFDLARDSADAQVHVVIDLRKGGVRRTSGATMVDETLRVQLEVRPENTFPLY